VHPYLIDLGRVDLPLLGPTHLALPTYGVLVAFAVLVGWLWFVRNARREGLPQDRAASAALWTLLAAILGGKVGLALVEYDRYLLEPSNMLRTGFLQAGGLIWAAVLAAILTLVGLALRWDLPLGRLLDAGAVPVPLSQAIGRLGCLMAGCCYGDQCALPWAVVYHSHEAHARTGVPLGTGLHPAPIYEALWCLLAVLPLVLLARRWRRRPGEVALIYCVAYGTGRFFIEFARGDAGRGLWFDGALSTSQIISLVVVPVALAVYFVLRFRAPAAPIERGPEPEPPHRES
jgi:phosphatidylglycerol:prolipoprotein diacylglycerol transferase